MSVENKINIGIGVALLVLAAVFKAFGAPTANEDYVDEQDHVTLTNAVKQAKDYTDQKDAETLQAAKDYADQHGGGGGGDTNAVDILANAAVVTNALTVATTNRVAALETATNNLSSSVSGLASSKADKAAPSYAGNLAALTADGNLSDSGKKASDFLPVKELGGDAYEVSANTTFRYLYGDALVIDPNNHWFWGARFFYDPSGTEAITDDANEIAVKGDISDAISATNPTFSSAVLAVQISTNDFAALYALKEAFADLPIDPVTGGISIGALLAALSSAVAWLKKNKVGSFASVGGASATVENGVAKLDDFFTESNSLLTGRVNTLIDAKVGDVNAVLAAALDGTEVA